MADKGQTSVSLEPGWTNRFRRDKECSRRPVRNRHRLGIMEERYHFHLRRCLAIGLIMFSIYTTSRAQSTSGFLSIDCGSSCTYIDNITTLTWEGDGNFTRTGLGATGPLQVNLGYNDEALGTFRYFPEPRTKYCYDLYTTANISYNVRAMFLHGGAPELTLPITFGVFVNNTLWNTLHFLTDYTAFMLNTPKILDGIWFFPGHLTHFCLVPIVGVPFISSLELRPLDPEGIMYSINGQNSWYLSADARWNFGPKNASRDTIRYPDDPYDRLWNTQLDPVANVTPTTGTATNMTSSLLNNVPRSIMQDAWLNNEPNSSIELLTNVSIGTESAYVAVYVEEINSSSSAGSRSFDVNFNGNIKTVTASRDPAIVEYFNFPLLPQSFLNVTATPNSTLGPIVNAMELYFMRQISTAATAAQDVATLASLQVSFNLMSWQGDPCFPVAWEWINCTSDMPAKVDKLLLSGYRINTTIPSIISDLQSLTQIDLSENHLFGAIPDSLASLPNLTMLSLSDNQLSGEVPYSLLKKLGSNFQYSGNALLTTNLTTKGSTNVGVIVGPTVGGLVVIGIAMVGLMWCWSSKRRKLKQSHPYDEIDYSASWWYKRKASLDDKAKEDEFLESLPNMPRRYSLRELSVATLGFTKELGSGGFGTVYEGLLTDGSKIAVKKLHSSKGTKDFRAELSSLGSIHHVNLVRLKGFCTEGEENMLVYEYMPNGSLDRWLFRNTSESESIGSLSSVDVLDWDTRFKIALGTAQGLAYLHEGCSERIIHLDIKPQNILLDQDFNPKVADFGLSKLVDKSISMVVTTMRGTPGYLAPEWLLQAAVTERTDVYSYGIVLLELVAGRKALDLSANQYSKQRYLPIWLLQCVIQPQSDVLDIVDPRLDMAKHEEDQITKVIHIALQCIQEEMMCRPSMVAIVQMLEGLVEVPDLQVDTLSARYRFASSSTETSRQSTFTGELTRSSTRSLKRTLSADGGLDIEFSTSTVKSLSSQASSSFNLRKSFSSQASSSFNLRTDSM